MVPSYQLLRKMAEYIAANLDEPRYRIAASNFIAFLDELMEDGWLSPGYHEEMRRIVRPGDAATVGLRPANVATARRPG